MAVCHRRDVLAGLAASAALLPTGRTYAADWPSRPVTIIVPWPAGGSTDVVARLLARTFSVTFGQTFIVDNRAGANGNVGAAFVAHTEPDGQTLMFTTNGPLTNSTLLYKKLSFDPMKDFAPIAMLGETPIVVAVSPSLPVNSMKELADYARRNPGKKLNVGNPGNGTVGHLTSKLWQFNEGIEMVEIPYRGTAPLLNNLMGGVVDVAFDLSSAYVPQIKAGAIRALAVTAPARMTDLPDTPTAAEQGAAYMVASSWFALVAPAKTDKAVIDKLSRTAIAYVQTPEGKAQIAQTGVIPTFFGPDDLTSAQSREVAKWKSVIEKADIRLD